MKGYVAVQRKLLILVFTLYKKNQPYDPNFAQKIANIKFVDRIQILPTLDDHSLKRITSYGGAHLQFFKEITCFLT